MTSKLQGMKAVKIPRRFLEILLQLLKDFFVCLKASKLMFPELWYLFEKTSHKHSGD